MTSDAGAVEREGAWVGRRAGWSPLDLLDVRGARVIDVGCGDGGFVRRLAALGALAIGVEPSGEQLARARAQPPVADERYLEGAAEQLPLEAASADTIVFVNSLHHVPEDALDTALEEAVRVLRPGGTLYIQEPLAAGSYFELVRLVDDETRVRRLAHEAILRAAPRLGAHTQLVLTQTVTHRDLDSVRRRLVGVDARRREALDGVGDGLAHAFERLGEHGEAGSSFEQPMRIDLFALAP